MVVNFLFVHFSFKVSLEEFNVVRCEELKENGAKTPVTNDNREGKLYHVIIYVIIRYIYIIFHVKRSFLQSTFHFTSTGF